MGTRYRTLVFDCDGVLLDSNRIKTNAFREVALRYGEEPAESLVRFHVQNGGVSRFRKFEHLLSSILGRDASQAELAQLSGDYGRCVVKQLLACQVASGLELLREATPDATWMVVSGGAQHELREVFAQRGLDRLFDGGIFGSPDSKDEILAREVANGRINQPALFLGDSRYDHEAATRAGLDFLFVSGWTEFSGWHAYCDERGIASVTAVGDLLAEHAD